jgi:ferredoxin-NADP reductase
MLDNVTTVAAAAGHFKRDIPFWDAELDDRLVCRQVRAETHDVKTFVFAAAKPRQFHFRPGQFLTFALEIDGATVHRCYTISSPPTRPHLLSITVKRQPGGLVSNWLHDSLRPGIALSAFGPLGVFTMLAHPAPKYLFLSGGSGITPLMSMARSIYDLAAPSDIVFVHNARSPADIIFRRELDLIAAELPGFRLAHVCEHDAPDERWAGNRGRLTLDTLLRIAPDFVEREVFCCGPAPYMAAVRAMLKGVGFDHERLHEESFSFEDHVEPGSVGANGATCHPTEQRQSFSIKFTRSDRLIDCAADMTILDAADAAGLVLPFSCTQGLCGTCKSKLISGSVEMRHAGGIRQREIDAGQILLCCSKPTGDLVIER